MSVFKHSRGTQLCAVNWNQHSVAKAEASLHLQELASRSTRAFDLWGWLPTAPLLFHPTSQPCASHVLCSSVLYTSGSLGPRAPITDAASPHPLPVCSRFWLPLSLCVPLNCRGWMLYSKGPGYCSTPLTLQDSDCSDVGTLGHTHGSICLPLEHIERCKLCFNIFQINAFLPLHLWKMFK